MIYFYLKITRNCKLVMCFECKFGKPVFYNNSQLSGLVMLNLNYLWISFFEWPLICSQQILEITTIPVQFIPEIIEIVS